MIEQPKDHTILVSGATGRQGGAVARHLHQRGFPVRALTRDPKQGAAQELAESGMEIVKADLEKPESLGLAFDGVYGAYSMQNSITEGVANEVETGKAFADAARDAGVEHFVYSSVAGANRNTGIPHFESKGTIEGHIRSLGLPSTILRPVFFMNNWAGFKETILGGEIPQPLSPNTRLQQVAVDDIGAFTALAFASPEDWIGRAVEIAGDDLTMTEIAETFSAVLGRTVKYDQIPWDTFEAQAGKDLTAMYRWFESGGFEADIEALCRIHPGITCLKSFLHDENWGQA